MNKIQINGEVIAGIKDGDIWDMKDGDIIYGYDDKTINIKPKGIVPYSSAENVFTALISLWVTTVFCLPFIVIYYLFKLL